jgi:hypothetical protein
MRTIVFVLLALLPACASARLVRLKAYEPGLPPASIPELAGKRVWIAPIDDARSGPESSDATPTTPDGAGFVHTPPTEEANRSWRRDVQEAAKTQEPRHELGASGQVVSADAPAVWLRESLEMELRNQGATVAAAPAESDASVSLKLVHLSVGTSWFSIRSRIVADLVVERPAAAPLRARVNTTGARTNWWGAAHEFYVPLHEAQQRLVWHTLRAIAGIEPPTKPPESPPSDSGL